MLAAAELLKLIFPSDNSNCDWKNEIKSSYLKLPCLQSSALDLCLPHLRPRHFPLALIIYIKHFSSANGNVLTVLRASLITLKLNADPLQYVKLFQKQVGLPCRRKWRLRLFVRWSDADWLHVLHLSWRRWLWTLTMAGKTQGTSRGRGFCAVWNQPLTYTADGFLLNLSSSL